MNSSQKDSKNDLQRQTGVQSIYRATALLRSVAKNNDKGGSNLSKIARNTGLHIATAHRILLALVREGFLSYDPISKLYHLGPELFSLVTSAHQYSIRQRYRPGLERIAEETQDTVFLIIRLGIDSLCLDRVEGKFPIRTLPIEVGDFRPVGFGVGSLSLIAFLPDEHFESIILANERRYAQYNKDLKVNDIRELGRRSRKLGYVVGEGIFHEGIIGVGMPIYDKRREVIAGISVSAISQRMPSNRRKKIIRLIKDVSSECV